MQGRGARLIHCDGENPDLRSPVGVAGLLPLLLGRAGSRDFGLGQAEQRRPEGGGSLIGSTWLSLRPSGVLVFSRTMWTSDRTGSGLQGILVTTAAFLRGHVAFLPPAALRSPTRPACPAAELLAVRAGTVVGSGADEEPLCSPSSREDSGVG